MQFLADQIDQMDLALDQLAMNDRNFDRFALMLIDNVVELTLHNYAQDRSYENEPWGRVSDTLYDKKMIAAALGQRFDAKVRLARSTRFLSSSVCDSVIYLHSYRNTAYHRGMRHNGILHSLALYYFKIACSILSDYSPKYWCCGSEDKISHRASKYLSVSERMQPWTSFDSAWERLKQVAENMTDTLVLDLHKDMMETIGRTDDSLKFLVDNMPGEKRSRDAIVMDCQIRLIAFTGVGLKFAQHNQGPDTSSQNYIEWMMLHYPWPVKADPVLGWTRRLESLKNENDSNVALKKYCDFLNQTEEIRAAISEEESLLDSHIQQLIDEYRGK